MKPKRWSVFTAPLVVGLLTSGCSGGSGTGSGGGPPAPAAALSPSSLSFTATDGGYPTAAQTVTITNTGNAAMAMTGAQIQGTDSAYFSQGSGECGEETLQPNASCSTKVFFTPEAARSYSAQLVFTDNAATSPQTVTLTGSLAAPSAPVAAARFGYVEDIGGGVHGFTISSSGTWTPTSPSVVGSQDFAGAMVIDPLGQFLFTAGLEEGSVLSFSITPNTGVLVLAGMAFASNSNNRPENMAIDPTGSFIYVSNTGIGTVTEYTVNRANGGLTEGGTVTLPLYPSLQQGDQQPGGLVTDSTGKYLYVSEAGYIASYSIDPTSGALTPLSATNPQGGACFNLHLDASATYLYCAEGNLGRIDIYSINPATGALTLIAGAGQGVPAGQSATDIGVTSDDKFAYVTDATGQEISLFTGNASNGLLTPLTPDSSLILTGEPYAIAIDPDDQLAYIVNESGSLNIMTINADGTISHFNSVPIDDPIAIAIYP